MKARVPKYTFLKTRVFSFYLTSFILKNYDIQYFSMRDIDQIGIQKVMEQTFDLLIGK